eukprot:CAMPEP_0181227176 /NCGR_PEP_ID=MMETSP1096-20121128/32649_1 /TAXON_ID=156174 ORGANISM="Chrysochromulina ericina, Strain CCMP281" /NCGR_SAMPLE_ID=MMETSP1096 /ASSEMBLY_ACC=CAM_ASM_000453 /LENGTH=118 /DNA_ID=CAMNT_0023320565 /DNA_START=494 /DNA_END=850 /DNA_ORIENTATION=-
MASHPHGKQELSLQVTHAYGPMTAPTELKHLPPLSSCLRCALLMNNPSLFDQARDLDGQPRTHPKRHRVRNPEMRYIPCPEGPEVRVKADLASPVHLLCFTVELRQRELRRRGWVADG